ncbi:MAG: cupin domain-containing protein [Candidatus Paceibacterota bacterium]|jgi:mannose-6-phosphate isomerase-like protein (cupin superfamily)
MSFITNIEKASLENTNFRTVLYTSKFMQIVVMSIPVGGDIGMEIHHIDQFIRIEKGNAKSILNGVERDLVDGDVVVITAGTEHNIVNTGSEDLKLYTVYATPNHKKGTIHVTKADAEADEKNDVFDGEVDE